MLGVSIWKVTLFCGWNPDDTLEQLFMGNDLCLEDNTLEEYYMQDTDSFDHFSHSQYYTYAYDS